MLDNHIMSICKAANFQLYHLSRIGKYLTPEALCIAVHAFISSRIDYCNGVLVGLLQSSTSQLQHIMNCAAHLIMGIKKLEHITLVLESLHCLPVHFRIQFKIMCLVFKVLHGQAPVYISDALTNYVPSLVLRSEDKGLLVVPRVRTKKYGERAFAYAAPYLFNTLSEDIHLAKSLESLRLSLKPTFLGWLTSYDEFSYCFVDPKSQFQPWGSNLSCCCIISCFTYYQF